MNRTSSTRVPAEVRASLTPARVVEAALSLVDRDGLDALSMRTVAAELDTGAASLYRHVADRDELLVLMLERVAEGLPRPAGVTPRERLRSAFLGMHATAAERPWVVHVLAGRRFVGRGALPLVDQILGDFIACGLTPTEAAYAYRTVWHLAVGDLLSQAPLDEDSQAARVFATVTPVSHPNLATVLPHFVDAMSRGFPAQLDTLLSALLPQPGRPTPSAGPRG